MKNIKLFILIIFIFFCGYIVFKNFPERNLSESAILSISQEISKTCVAKNGDNECYEEEILRIAPSINMNDSFAITKEVQKINPSYAYCHVLAHKLSFLEAQRRPNDWKSIVTQCPVYMCNYGCLHGSLVERYRGEVLDDFQIESAVIELQDVCDPRDGWKPSHLDRNMCYHALGHLSMYMTGADVSKSLKVCKDISIKKSGEDFYEVCVEGVFMTIFQGIDPDEVALVAAIKPEPENVRSFCDKYNGLDYEACNRESFPLFSEKIRNPDYLSTFCSYSKNEYGITKCYGTAISSITISFLENRDVQGLVGYCSQIIGIRKAQCFASGATRILQNDIDSLDLATIVCDAAQQQGVGNECVQELIHFFNSAYKKDDPKINEFCKTLPNSYYQECITNYGNNI